MNKLNHLPHHCYIITNKINNKIYIGVTYKSIEKRFAEHVKVSRFKSNKSKMPINFAIQKYGKENFIINILKTFNTGKEAYDAEINYIKEYNSNNDQVGYNVSQGGDCGPNKLKFDFKTIINILKDYCNNLSFKELSEKYNIPKHSIFDITRLRFSKTHNIPNELLDKVKNKKLNSNKRKKVDCNLITNIINDFTYLNLTMQQLADKYQLSPSNVWSIVHRETFKKIKIDSNLEDQLNKKLNLNRYWAK